MGRSIGSETGVARSRRHRLGTRDVEALLARLVAGPDGERALLLWQQTNPQVRVASFAEAAAYGDIVVNATNGAGSLDALRTAGDTNLDGKVFDIAEPLDLSHGMPPSLFVSNTDSLGEQIQRAFPGSRVVKTLNTMNASVMVDPALVAGGEHTVFVSGNDEEAKAQVSEILRSFGWRDIVDLGDITTARGTEMYLSLWLRLWASSEPPRSTSPSCSECDHSGCFPDPVAGDRGSKDRLLHSNTSPCAVKP